MDNVPVFNKYEVVEKIAVYPDKAIYKVKDVDGDLYMTKVFKKTYKYSLYENLSKLTHKNMPLIHEVTLLEDCFYVIEDCIAGRTLREILDDSGALGKKETLNILLQLCDVLAYLHNQPTPIIHRDITPTNIMITDNGIVKLIDFDIAREHKGEAISDTEIIGTKYFAPPEQYGFSQSDPRTDIYALGMLMTVMMTNTYEMQRMKDAQIASVIERCMMLSPNKRFQTVKKLKERLERISNNKLEPHVKFAAVSAILILLAIVLSIALLRRAGEEADNNGSISGNALIYDEVPASDNAHLEYIRLIDASISMAADIDVVLNPAFDSAIFDYTVYLPHDFGRFHMRFAPYNRESSAVLYVGERAFWPIERFGSIVSTGFASEPGIQGHRYVPAGEEIIISIVVTSEDRTTTETYTIRYIRQGADE